MGTSSVKETLINNTVKHGESILKEKPQLENLILKEELSSRNKIGKKEEKTESDEKKFDLNIIIYSDTIIYKGLNNSIKNDSSEYINWKIEEFKGFSPNNSSKIINICKNHFKEKKFKDVVIIPIKSIFDFKKLLEEKGKDIFEKFNDLNEEEQPFILIIDEEKNDFIKKQELVRFNFSKKKDINTYTEFLNILNRRIISYKRAGKDFNLRAKFVIFEYDKINIFMNYLIKKKKNKDDFSVLINDKIFYQNLYDIENIDIQSNKNFKTKLEEDIKINNILKVKLILYNVKLNEHYDYFEQFGINDIEILSYNFKNEVLNNILNNSKYEYIDKRNFKVIRTKQSPKNYLLKFTGYYNQLGDILFYDQVMFYSAKINIAIGGYIGSGKSTLINTIFGDKRCLEGKGSSITNYISQFSLKNYPINFFDFPGFRAKRNGKKNTTLFIEEIKGEISNLKKMKEDIHCFLFCIKYDERIFDENDEDMMEVFDAIVQLKIRTFFIITGSEREEKREFKDFKNIIINNLEEVNKKYPKDLINKIFGADLNKAIIPILARDKRFHGFTAKAFGLDNLFHILYDYFFEKKIDYQKEIYFDEEKLKIFINNNELLKIFESKQKLSNDLRNKIKIELEKFLMNLFLKAPKYLYNFSKDSIFEIINELLDHFFYIFNCYLAQKSSVEKFQFVNMFVYQELKLKCEEEFNHFENNVIKPEDVEQFKNYIPWYAKIIFPVLSPFYYLLGTPIFKLFSGKITDYFMEEIAKFNLDECIFEIYFEGLTIQLNKGIDGLNEIRKYFERYYDLKKLENEICQILSDEFKEITNKNLKELGKILDKLVKNEIKVLEQYNKIVYENENYFPVNDNGEFKTKKNIIENFIKNYVK